MASNDLASDSRFASLITDPKFKKPPKLQRKVKIDKRFQSMFHKDEFKIKYSVDKRGRPMVKSTTEDYKKFYDLSSDEETDDSTTVGLNKTRNSGKKEKKKKPKKIIKNDFPQLNEEEKNQITSSVRKKLKDIGVDYARGEGKLVSSDSSDESESDYSEYENLHHEWNELDRDAETTQKITNRLAVCNMDWDRIRAVDLMMLFNSFLPPASVINSVIIYPSEFGLERMKEEEFNGPAELVNESALPSIEDESEEENEEGEKFHMERMRQYQINRLRYYYAIATFDSVETADIIYTNCNGVEYECSGIRLDLRFVDDDMIFDQEPKDVCDSLKHHKEYEPRFFINTALQQAKVLLTWDETDPKRLEFTQKIAEAAKTADINDSDLENFVALSSSEDERETIDDKLSDTFLSENESEEKLDDKIDPITRYRNLLKEIEENEKCDKEEKSQLEITWGYKTSKISEKTLEGEKMNTLIQKQLNGGVEKLSSKRKNNKKLIKHKDEEGTNNSQNVLCSSDEEEENRSSENLIDDHSKFANSNELELLLLSEDEENQHHFNFDEIKKKKSKSKKKKYKKKEKTIYTDDFQVDVSDNRFEAMYSAHAFNIDPTNPRFHSTKGMNAFVLEKQKRISQRENGFISEEEPMTKKGKIIGTLNSDTAHLVKSIKNKTKTLFSKFKKK